LKLEIKPQRSNSQNTRYAVYDANTQTYYGLDGTWVNQTQKARKYDRKAIAESTIKWLLSEEKRILNKC